MFVSAILLNSINLINTSVLSKISRNIIANSLFVYLTWQILFNYSSKTFAEYFYKLNYIKGKRTDIFGTTNIKIVLKDSQEVQ